MTESPTSDQPLVPETLSSEQVYLGICENIGLFFANGKHPDQLTSGEWKFGLDDGTELNLDIDSCPAGITHITIIDPLTGEEMELLYNNFTKVMRLRSVKKALMPTDTICNPDELALYKRFLELIIPVAPLFQSLYEYEEE